MTEPLYKVRILYMPIEKFAGIAIDGAIWLTGEYLSQGRKITRRFFRTPPISIGRATAKLLLLPLIVRTNICGIGY
jgi:hypothetical protein